jgi:hypothetical protein
VTISFDTKGFGDVTVAAYVAMLAMRQRGRAGGQGQ